jgi:hypothetical protein
MPHLDPPLETETDNSDLDVPPELDLEPETDVDDMDEDEIKEELENLLSE